MSRFDPLAPMREAEPLAIAPGPLTVRGDEAAFETQRGRARVTLHDFGARLRIGERKNDYGLISEPVPAAITVAEASDRIRIEGAGHSLFIEKATCALELRKRGRVVVRSATDGHFARRFRLPPIARRGDGWIVHLDLASGEPVYGLGEKWGALDRRGQLIHSFNEDSLGVNAEASYKNTPFAWGPNGWGAFVHTSAPVTHGAGFAQWSHRAYGLFVEDDALDLFLFSGETGAEIIAQYTALTGRAPVPPLWSLGAILSRAYYKDSAEVLAVAREVRSRGMPCDTIAFDGRAWQATDTRFAFEWDSARYPDPKGVIDELKSLGFKICLWEYPLVSAQNGLFAEMSAKGWLLKDRRTGDAFRYRWSGEAVGDVLTALPESGLVDFTNPEAYAFWRDRHAALFAMGVDMIKADFGEQVTDDMVASNGEAGRALHNVYAFLYNKCVYEAAERYGTSGAFLFSRAGWTGSQRFPSQWGGDPQADWEGLAASLRGGLSWGMSGAPYYATDIGGFYGDARDPKLYVRWLQAGIFSAHLRLHGIGPREPWTYGREAEAAAMAALKLRYRMIPYLHAAMKESSATGLPVQRAMALAFPGEREAWAFDDQFMFGPDLLVAPCIGPDDLVAPYLPRGGWARFPTGERFEGGRVHELKIDLSDIAVFAREGSEIPLGPEIHMTAELGGAPRVKELVRF